MSEQLVDSSIHSPTPMNPDFKLDSAETPSRKSTSDWLMPVLLTVVYDLYRKLLPDLKNIFLIDNYNKTIFRQVLS